MRHEDEMSHYKPPESNLSSESSLDERRVLLGKVLSYFSLLSIVLVAGLISFTLHMTTTFETINEIGVNDPKIMANVISQMFVPVMLSSIMSLPSVIAIFLVIFITSYRSKHFYWFWILVTLALILSFPIGTVFGLALGIILFIKRNEFLNP